MSVNVHSDWVSTNNDLQVVNLRKENNQKAGVLFKKFVKKTSRG